MRKKSEEKILKEILKECNWYEKIIVLLCKKTIIKTYHISRINTCNQFLEKTK